MPGLSNNNGDRGKGNEEGFLVCRLGCDDWSTRLQVAGSVSTCRHREPLCETFGITNKYNIMCVFI